MDISTIALYLYLLLFSGFSFFVNSKATRDPWLKVLTLVLGLVGLFGAGYLLLILFIDYIK